MSEVFPRGRMLLTHRSSGVRVYGSGHRDQAKLVF